MAKYVKPKKKFPFFRILTLCLALGMLAFGTFKMYGYITENRQSEQAAGNLREEAVVQLPQVPDNTPEQDANIPEGTDEVPSEILQEEPEYPAISYEIPIQVDFEYLQAQNPDIIAWIYSENTNIDYPIVQADDNQYYMYRLPDGTQNPSGSIFMDFRNQVDFSDYNSVIYGHNMGNGTMFASLLNYKKQAYYEDHPHIWILTPARAYRMDLIAGLTTSSDSQVFNIYDSRAGLLDMLDKAVGKSTFETDLSLGDVENVAMLSTCTYEYSTARYVVIGSLVPAEYLPQEELDRLAQLQAEQTEVND